MLQIVKCKALRYTRFFFGKICIRDHPFKTSACLKGGGVKNWPNLPTDSSKKTADGGG